MKVKTSILLLLMIATALPSFGGNGNGNGTDSYGRQQWGILHNGGNSDAAMPREGRRF